MLVSFHSNEVFAVFEMVARSSYQGRNAVRRKFGWLMIKCEFDKNNYTK